MNRNSKKLKSCKQYFKRRTKLNVWDTWYPSYKATGIKIVSLWHEGGHVINGTGFKSWMDPHVYVQLNAE